MQVSQHIVRLVFGLGLAQLIDKQMHHTECTCTKSNTNKLIKTMFEFIQEL